MAIAYSGATILKTTLRGDTSTHFRADLDAALLACGWALIRNVTNGKVYEATSPTSLKMRLLVQDQGTSSLAGPWIIFQVMNAAETVLGIAHTIVIGGLSYQAIVGVCQLFISVPGFVSAIYSGDQSSSFACGIPAIPLNSPDSLCVVGIGDPPAVTEFWWSCGPGNAPFFYDPDFRSGPTCFLNWCVDFNGVLQTAPPTQDSSQGMLGLGYLTPTFNVDGSGAPNQPVVTYLAATPLRLDALLLWQWAIRGQLWDAFQMSAPQTLDGAFSFQDNNADGSTFLIQTQCWNQGYYSSLMLLTQSPVGQASFAYVY